MRWMLLVDTCGAAGSVAVADLQQPQPAVTAQEALPGRETQERLLPAVVNVLQQSGQTAATLDAVAVVTGPGSFTGVRIGLAAVKGIAEALGKPVVAVSRLAVLAAQSHEPGEVQAWLDAGRGDVFVGRYRNGVLQDEFMMRGGDAAAAAAACRVVVMEDAVERLAPHSLRVPPVGVREALPIATAMAAAGNFADAALLNANYLRVPDAELARLAATAKPPA